MFLSLFFLHLTVRKLDEPENERFVTLSPIGTEKWRRWWRRSH